MQVRGASQVTETSNKTEQMTQKMILNQKKYMQNAKLEFIYLKSWKISAAQKYKTTNLQRKVELFKQKRVQ